MKSLLLFLFLSAWALAPAQSGPSPYPHLTNVGDIAPDPSLDDPSFTLCNPGFVPQYYMVSTTYKGERRAIKEHFFKNYRPVNAAGKGFITIRFIVNCQSKAGRFRMESLDDQYQPASFPAAITDQLLTLTRQLEGWLPGSYRDVVRDSYVYLTFTIRDGSLLTITP
jgi:hypothetical protein